ncbi:hypothetical protein BCU91_13135 [Shewanella sp. 10N.286.52.B9]|nr:hypothetical protein BCU91_13135 [Shewanella sp. 10N.286.52.B9]
MTAVHYLNGSDLGGTCFYRYKGTEKLGLSVDDKEVIIKMVEDVKKAANNRKGYMDDSDELFEKVFSVDAKPNRIIIYSGNLLHSANITEHIDFDKKSPNNRTSINSFFRVGASM